MEFQLNTEKVSTTNTSVINCSDKCMLDFSFTQNIIAHYHCTSLRYALCRTVVLVVVLSVVALVMACYQIINIYNRLLLLQHTRKIKILSHNAYSELI